MLQSCCDSIYLSASAVVTQSFAHAVTYFRAIAAFGAHVQPAEVQAEHDEDTARSQTTQCVMQMVSILWRGGSFLFIEHG